MDVRLHYQNILELHVHLLPAVELETDVAFAPALVIFQFRRNHAVDFHHDVAADGAQFEVGPFALFIFALFNHLRRRPMHPRAAAGLVESSRFL